MPQASKGSIDYYIYKFIMAPIAEKICFIHPNVITVIAFLLFIPIIYNLVNKQSYFVFGILVLLRQLLDSLDGQVARSCHKQSKLGAILDISCDVIGNIILIYFVTIHLNNSDISFNLKKIFNVMMFITTCILIYVASLEYTSSSWFTTVKNNNSIYSKILILCHDNGTILSTLLILLVKLFYNSLNVNV